MIMSPGPKNANGFIVFSLFSAYQHLDRLSARPLLVFMTAALLLAGAFLRVADLTQYISRTVVVAYVTGAAMLISASQLPVVLGISKEVLNDGLTPAITLPGHLFRILTHLTKADWVSVLCAAFTLIVYFVVKILRPRWPVFAITLIVVSLGFWLLALSLTHLLSCRRIERWRCLGSAVSLKKNCCTSILM